MIINLHYARLLTLTFLKCYNRKGWFCKADRRKFLDFQTSYPTPLCQANSTIFLFLFGQLWFSNAVMLLPGPNMHLNPFPHQTEQLYLALSILSPAMRHSIFWDVVLWLYQLLLTFSEQRHRHILAESSIVGSGDHKFLSTNPISKADGCWHCSVSSGRR